MGVIGGVMVFIGSVVVEFRHYRKARQLTED
jgi:hypothetical protein